MEFILRTCVFGIKELLFALRCPYRPVKAVITQGLITESSWEAEDSAHQGQKYPSNMEVMEWINITKVAQTQQCQWSNAHLRLSQVSSSMNRCRNVFEQRLV